MADESKNTNAYILHWSARRDFDDNLSKFCHMKNLVEEKDPLGTHVTRILTVCRNVCHPAT